MTADRNAMVEKARNRHSRRHPEQTPPPAEPGLLGQVQGAVATAVQAVGHAATAAVKTVKETVIAPQNP